MKEIPSEISTKIFGIDHISDPRVYKNKAKLVTWQEFPCDYSTSLPLCIELCPLDGILKLHGRRFGFYDGACLQGH